MSADPKELEKRMHGALDALKKEFAGLRTGRASVNLLDPIMVDAYGQRMPLNQVGTVSAPEPRWGRLRGSERAVRPQVGQSPPRASGLPQVLQRSTGWSLKAAGLPD